RVLVLLQLCWVLLVLHPCATRRSSDLAVNLLSGGRGSVDYIRHGANKAELNGLFNLEENMIQVINLAKQYDINIEDNMIILERTITDKGKSICRINGK